jgi:archaellum component FlaC
MTKNELSTLVHDDARRKTVGSEPSPTSNQVTRDQHNQTANALLQTEMEILEAKAALETAQSQLALSAQGETDRLHARVLEEFEKDPETIALINEIKNAKKSLDHARKLVQLPNDPSVVHADRHHKSLIDEWNNLWNQKKEKIEARLAAEGRMKQLETWQAKVAELQVSLEKLKRKKANLSQRIEHLREGDSAGKGDHSKEADLKPELDRKLRMREIFQQELARSSPQEKSSRPDAKANDDRPKQAKESDNEEGPSAAERIEKELKDLVEKLGKDVSPVGEQVRKALERAVGEIHQSLTKASGK